MTTTKELDANIRQLLEVHRLVSLAHETKYKAVVVLWCLYIMHGSIHTDIHPFTYHAHIHINKY